MQHILSAWCPEGQLASYKPAAFLKQMGSAKPAQADAQPSFAGSTASMEKSASLLLGQIEQELSALRQHTVKELEQKVLSMTTKGKTPC